MGGAEPQSIVWLLGSTRPTTPQHLFRFCHFYTTHARYTRLLLTDKLTDITNTELGL